jgi:hypothetical protein
MYLDSSGRNINTVKELLIESKRYFLYIDSSYNQNSLFIHKTKGVTMKINIMRLFFSISLSILFVSSAVGQGLYWESVTKGSNDQSMQFHSSVSYMPKMYKQVTDRQTIVFRLDKDRIYMIDYKDKEYAEMTFAEMEAATKQAMGQMDELKEQMKDMPPEQREAMEKMLGNTGMGSKSKSKMEVAKTGEKSTISGYSCVKYILKENGKEVGIIWTTASVSGYDGMKKDMKKFSERLMAQMPKGKELSDAILKINGFPIQTQLGNITSTVTKVEKKKIATSEFEVPAGFKKVSPKEITGK